MDADNPGDHFDHLSTSWTLLGEAHDSATPQARREAALEQVIERYQNLVRRYLAGALRQERNAREAVDECFQEFGLRVLRGAFKGAAPERGRFRDYLWTCLANLVNDYHRKRRRELEPLEDREPAAEEERPVSEQEFLAMWREELVARALRALEAHERQTGQWLYAVLKLKMEHPQLRSEQLAERLAPAVGKPLTAEWARKRLFLARGKLAALLLDEVRQSLREPTDEQVYEELADLGLLEYCRSALPQ